MKYIAIYVRVSTVEQATDGYGLDAQVTRINEYLEFNKYDLSKVRIYREEGVSAKSLDRPVIQTLMQDISNGKIETLIVYKLDRLSRSVKDMYSLMQLFLDNDVQFISIVGNIDISSANGRMIFGLLSTIAQWERETISERTQDGLAEKIMQGKYPYRLPYGYKRDENEYLIINRKEANNIKKIYDFVIEGYSLEEIRRYLIDNDIIHFKATNSISNLIKKEIHKGIFTYKNQVYYDVAPRIVSDEEWEEANKKISERYKTDINSEKFLFERNLYCIKCGRKLNKEVVNKKHKKYFYYMCESCKKRIGQNKLLNKVVYRLVNQNNKVIDEIMMKEKKDYLDKLRYKQQEFYEAFIDGKVSIDEYESFLKYVEDKIDHIKKTLFPNTIYKVSDFYNLTSAQKQKYLNYRIKKIDIDLDAEFIRIEYKKEEKDMIKTIVKNV